MDAPQAKASRRQQKEHALEHCQGYVDKNGMWNNGFYCPRWGGPEDNYCCGDGTERFCCPEPAATDLVTSSTAFNASSDVAFNFVPIVIGISVGLLVFILGLVVGYFICPCCPGRTNRTRKRSLTSAASSGQANTVRRTLSVSLEAEATSAVIAAQALVPLQGGSVCQASPAPSSSTNNTADELHLHCGCHWSPSTSRSTVVDVDPSSTYHSPAMTWQTELDNMYNCSCEKALLNESKTMRTPAEHLYQMLAATGRHVPSPVNHPSSGSSSPLCLESFRPPPGSDSHIPYHHHHHHHHHHQQQQQQQHRLLSQHQQHIRGALLQQMTGSDVLMLQQPSPRCQPRTYGAMSSVVDVDGQRRDSGVLIEDSEQVDGIMGSSGGSGSDTFTAASSVLPMPSLSVERIGRVTTAR